MGSSSDQMAQSFAVVNCAFRWAEATQAAIGAADSKIQQQQQTAGGTEAEAATVDAKVAPKLSSSYSCTSNKQTAAAAAATAPSSGTAGSAASKRAAAAEVHVLPACLGKAACHATCPCLPAFLFACSFGPNLGIGATPFSPSGLDPSLLGEASPNKVSP